MNIAKEDILSKVQTNAAKAGLATATFGEGCFWCSESYFKELKGVKEVISGYSGGQIPNPTYEQVCSGNTSYAEVSNILYDPKIIHYDLLLEAFWSSHDPTTLNRQGHDVGPQYRSVVFYHNKEQKEKAQHYKQKINSSGIYKDPIVTTIEPMSNFYTAEYYLQDFYENNPHHPYCTIVIQPKLKKFKQLFKKNLK